MAVPTPSRMALTAQGRKLPARAVPARARAWSSMPPVIRGLRPSRSERGPVNSWPRPHTAGYSAASRPTWATGRPPRTNSSGSSPQARPSLRLLTSPAWLQADRAGSRQLVATTTWLVDSWSGAGGGWRLGRGRVTADGLIGVGQLGFEVGVPAGLTDHQRRQPEAEAGIGQAEIERLGTQPGPGSNKAGQVGGEGHRQVAGGLVETHGQPTATRAGQVDLHDHRRRPAQALVDPEQDIDGDDPGPGGRPDEQQGHGQADQPAGDQDRFAAVAVGQGAGQEVGGGLGEAEGDDVGQGGRHCGQPEQLGGEQRQHGPFLADHAADQGVDTNQEAELGQVGPQAKPQVPWADRWRLGHERARVWPVARCQSWGPPWTTRRSLWPARSRRLAAVMARWPWLHITVTGPSGSCAGSRSPARAPSSTATAPGRWPSATSLAWRTSRTTPGWSPSCSASTTGSWASGRRAARQAAIPPANSPAKWS